MKRQKRVMVYSLCRAAVFLGALAGTNAQAQTPLPSEAWVVAESTRDQASGTPDIYFSKADGTSTTRLTTTGARSPLWSPDGRWIAYETTTREVHVMRWSDAPNSGKKICDAQTKPAIQNFFWLPDNSGVVCIDPADGNRYLLVDPETETSSLLFQRGSFRTTAGFGATYWYPNAMSKSGRWIVVITDLARSGFVFNDVGFLVSQEVVAIYDRFSPNDVWFAGYGMQPTFSPIDDVIYYEIDLSEDNARALGVGSMPLSERQHRLFHREFGPDMLSQWGGSAFFPLISSDGEWLTTAVPGHPSGRDIVAHKLGEPASAAVALVANGVGNRNGHLFVGPLWGTGTARVSLAPTQLTHHLGGAAPPDAVVKVFNLGTGVLPTVQYAVSYDGPNTGWLTIVHSGSGNDQLLTTSINASALAEVVQTATVTVSCAANACTPSTYNYTIQASQLDVISMASASTEIDSGQQLAINAIPLDQYGQGISTALTWSLSGGGSLSATATASSAQPNVNFISDGSAGSYTITATSAQGVIGKRQITVRPVEKLSGKKSGGRYLERGPGQLFCGASPQKGGYALVEWLGMGALLWLWTKKKKGWRRLR